MSTIKDVEALYQKLKNLSCSDICSNVCNNHVVIICNNQHMIVSRDVLIICIRIHGPHKHWPSRQQNCKENKRVYECLKDVKKNHEKQKIQKKDRKLEKKFLEKLKNNEWYRIENIRNHIWLKKCYMKK